MKNQLNPDRSAPPRAGSIDGRSWVRRTVATSATWRPLAKTRFIWLIWLMVLAGLIYPLLAISKTDGVLASTSPSGKFKAYSSGSGGGRVDIVRIGNTNFMKTSDSWSARYVLKSTAGCSTSTTGFGSKVFPTSPISGSGYIGKGNHYVAISINNISGYKKAEKNQEIFMH